MNKGMQFQVECTTRDLVEMITEDFGWDSVKAMDVLYNSNTFKALEDARSGLYFQSPVYVYDILKEELTLGKQAY